MTVRRRGTAAALGLAVAACCAFATYAVHRVFVGTELGQVVDQATLEAAHSLPAGVAERAGTLLSWFTVPLVLAALLVPPLIGLLRRAPWHALAALAVLVGANLTTQVLKTYVFERPDLLSLGAPNSLPSGHTTVAASVALALVMVVPPVLRAPTAVLGVAASLLVGLATIVSGWHRLSDVVAAVLVTVGWAGAVLTVVVLRPRTTPPGTASSDGDPTVRRPQPTARR